MLHSFTYSFSMSQLVGDKRITINVGGSRFETNTSTLQSIRQSKLSSPEWLQQFYDMDRDEYFFDRNPLVFSAVLDLCRTGYLHLPSNLCGIHARSELEFWGISLQHLDKCCWKTFYNADNDVKLIAFLDEQFSYIEKQDVTGSSVSRIRRTIWRFFENPRSSKLAMIWYWIFMGTVFLSITVYLLDTYEVFREEPETSVFRPMGKFKQEEYANVRTTVSTFENNKVRTTEKYPNQNANAKLKYYSHELPELEGWKTQSVFMKTQGQMTFMVDIICNIVFSFEFLLRLCSCPVLLQFCLDILNIADFLSLSGFLIISIVNNLHKITSCGEKCYDSLAIMYTLTCAHFLLACRNLRFFRICRVNKGLKILFLSIDRSKKDMSLLCIVLVIMSVVFGGLVYYAEIRETEKFEYFHSCLYFAFTTMIMGGYGDTIPKTDSGNIIAAFCGLVGIIVLSMVIAVISGNFGELFARYKDRERHAKETEHPDDVKI